MTPSSLISERETATALAELLDSGTWLARFVTDLANLANNIGVTKLASDVQALRTVFEDNVQQFVSDMETARSMIRTYPDFRNEVCRLVLLGNEEADCGDATGLHTDDEQSLE